MNDTSCPTSPAPRGPPQFGLKSLLLWTLLSAVLFSGWAVALRRGQEAAAIARNLAQQQVAQQQLLAETLQQRLQAASQAPEDAISPSAWESVAAELEAVLRLQAEAWNAGDLDRFMEHYWNSDELTFSSGGQITRGWRGTLDRYRQRYPTTERMGRLTFDQLEVRPLGDAAALVLGRWHLAREDDMPGGNFSLVVRKLAGRWLIVHDHTSQAEKPAEPPEGA